MLTPVLLRNSSQYMCGALPMPADATVILPGLAFAAARSSGTEFTGSDGLTTSTPGPREWRTHIHVPVFLDDLGQFRTTRFAIEDGLRFHKQKPLSRHLEVETYTWDMLPDSLKSNDIVDYICRELQWVRGQLV